VFVISQDITFLSIFWLELIAISVPVVIFLLAATVLQYLQLVELKFAAGVVLATISVAIYAANIWEVEIWRAFLYSFGAMFLAAIPWAILLTLVNQLVEAFRNR
jgi:hypothetical protein